jgi:hypothetical protein
MKRNLLIMSLFACLCGTIGMAQNTPDTSDLKIGVQMTELGCMRALVAIDESASEAEQQLTQSLTEADFRVFKSARLLRGRQNHETLKVIGEEAQADLVVYAKVSEPREKNSFGKFKVMECEATVEVYSPISGELLVSYKERVNGTRHTDPIEAERSARERAVDSAAREAVARSLEKAHKLIVHQARLNNVLSHNHLLAIMDYMAKLEGVYHVRQVSYDLNTFDAEIEIIGAPSTVSFWRAHLEEMPLAQVIDLEYVENQEVRRKYPDWWDQK